MTEHVGVVHPQIAKEPGREPRPASETDYVAKWHEIPLLSDGARALPGWPLDECDSCVCLLLTDVALESQIRC